MNQFDNTPMMTDGGASGSLGWLQTWVKAVTQPNERAFAEIAESPEAKPQTAYLWVFIAAMATYFVSALAQGAVYMINGDSDSIGSVLGLTVCGAPIGGGIAVLGFMLSTAIVQWVAKLFGGQGNYDKLTYPLAAVYLPLSLVSAVLALFGLIPFVGICTSVISIAIGFYALFLNVTAVKAVNRFGWGEAAGSVLIPGVVLLVVCACVTIALLMIMGPVIGDVFNQINQSLQYAP